MYEGAFGVFNFATRKQDLGLSHEDKRCHRLLLVAIDEFQSLADHGTRLVEPPSFGEPFGMEAEPVRH